jgi:hypothetical protein
MKGEIDEAFKVIYEKIYSSSVSRKQMELRKINKQYSSTKLTPQQVGNAFLEIY